MTTTANGQCQGQQLVVHLADGRKIDICPASEEVNRTAQQVIQTIFDRLRITDFENVDGTSLPVALWACAKSLRLQLMPEHNIRQTREKMRQMIKNIPTDNEDESEIIFKLARNGFYTKQDEKIDDLTTLKLLFYEAKENIQNNILPRTALGYDQIIALRVIEGLIEKRQTEQQQQHVHENQCGIDCPGAAKAIKSELSYKNSLKKRFLTRSMSKHAAKRQTSVPDFDKMHDFQLYQHYLDICRKLDCYGGFFFEGQMERSFFESLTHGEYYDKKVGIIINSKGLHLVNLHCPKVEKFIELEHLEWGIMLPQKDKYHPCLYVKEADKVNSKLFQIFTYHAPFIDRTLKNLKGVH